MIRSFRFIIFKNNHFLKNEGKMKEKCQLFANKVRRIYYFCFVHFMSSLLLLFYMFLDRRGLTNTILCVQRYISIILRSGCIAHGETYPFPPYTFFLLFFFSLTLLIPFCPSSFGRLFCTCCSLTDLLSTVSARLRSGQLFFSDKTSWYILLSFSLFSCPFPFLTYL